ncbi:hypothetical protein ACET3X_001651 [Alternaria dauci]|uniref:Uncharacterized protein n=1 Tax=Alternaria dauci TaxID=48095 RepID=A0ABR3UY82_9PLEO
MAGKARRSEHPPKRQKLSRLRNEVRPESTDDEWDRRNNIVQVPNSDTVVSGTQPDHGGDSYHEDPIPDNQSDISLSPNSAALLERTAVTKKTKKIEHIPFSINLLSRNPIGMNDSSASAAPSPNPFAMSYSQTKRGFSKPYPKEDATAAESTHIGLRTLDTQQHEAHASQDLTAMAEPVHVPPHLPDDAHLDEPYFMSNPNMNVLDQPVTRRSREEPTHTPPMRLNETSDVLPSAQLGMRPVSRAGRVPGVKKRKKRKKGQLSQQPEGPGPRSRVTPSFAHQAETTGVLAPDTSADPRRLSENNTGGDEKDAFRATAFQGPAPVVHRHGHVHTTDSQLPNEEHGCIADDNESYNPTQSLMDTTSQDFQDSSAQRQFPTSSMQVLPTLPQQRDMVEPMQQPLVTFHDHAGSLGPDKRVALSTHTSGHCALPNSHGLVEVPAVPTQPQQPKSHADINLLLPQPGTTGTHPHSNSDRDGPLRMTKPRRKLRPSGPISHDIQGKTISPSIEDAMENFRVAILANKYRVQHETTTITQQHNAEIAELQQTINHQTQSIAEYEERYRKLEETLTELTNAAKRNQRIVTGLQQDHENLQKITKSFQKECGRTLTEKITELEDEKRALQQEVGTMTDKLAATQRKMRSTLEDVWKRLLLSESKREDLAENVGKLEAALNDERKNRDILSKQLLSGIHSIPRQIIDSSDALTEKIELLTASLENADARDSRRDQIKESLDVLQTLRQTPALTVQDIEKMSSILRLVHERLDSGLDTLSETVTGKVLPDAELQKFIKEQIHGLQTEMLKHEEVAAESRKMHELNIRLESQLGAQQKHCNELEEKIKCYANDEIDLKALYEQLKRDLSVLRDTPPIDTSGLEQEILDLCQKLQKAEEDLAAVNTRIEKMESERDTYKVIIFKLMSIAMVLTTSRVEEATAAGEQIAQDCQREFEEKERSFRREIHQLTVQRNEKEKTLQELNEKLDAADTRLDELNEKVQTLESMSVETTNFQKQLESMTDELHNKEGDCAELNRRFQEKTEEMLGLQDLCANLQTQLAQQQTTMQTLRQDADSELTKVRQDASDTLQLSSDQVSSLQMEKKNLSTRLEQVKMNEVKLQYEAAELRAAKEAEITRVKAEADEENRKLVEQHRIEADDLRRRMSQKDAAFKEMEAKFRLAEGQHKTKIAKDREKAESNMCELEQKYRDALRVAHEQGNLNQQVGFQVQTAKPRKKVSRQNQSMLEVPEKEDPHSQKSCSGFHAEVPQTQLEDEDLFATQFGGKSGINDIFNGTIDVNHETGTATKNQDIQSTTQASSLELVRSQ